jgi:hypothetical protein
MSEERSETERADESTVKDAADREIGRRSYLKMGAAAAALGPVSFAADARGASETRHGVSFDTVVDAVDDLGMDSSGNDAIDGALDRAVSSDTLIKFPPGQYLIEEKHGFLKKSNFGIVGTGSDRSDVEFVFPSGFEDRFLKIRYGTDWVFENFTVQQTDDRETGVGMTFAPDDGLHLHDVETAGFNPRNTERGLSVIVYDSDGKATVENYVRRGNSAVGDYPSGTQALLVPSESRGTIELRDLDIRNAGENGVYASRSSGEIHIEGGHFENNDIASVRIADEGSYVKDATFVIDTEDSDNAGSYDNSRGLWVESGGGAYAENCDFTLRSANNSGGLIRIAGTAGDFTIRNCRLHNETRFANIQAESGGGSIVVEGTSITADSSEQRSGAIDLTGRDGSRIENCCIATSGGGYDGIVLDNSDNVTVRRSTIDVSGEPIVTNGASVATSGISNSGSCPLPSSSGGGSTSGPNDGSSASDDDDEETSTEDTSTEDTSTEKTSTEETATEDTSSQESSTPEDGAETATDEETDTSDAESADETEASSDSDGGNVSRLSLQSENVAAYRIETSNGIEFVASYGTEDRIDGNVATGVLVGGHDVYRVFGEIVSFEIEDEADIRLDGKSVSASDLGGGSAGSQDDGSTESGEQSESEDEPESEDENEDEPESKGESEDESESEPAPNSDELGNTILIQSEAMAPYELEVGGDVAFDPNYGTEDEITDGSASGVLVGGADAYRFSGEITDFEIGDEADVYVNGKEVNPDEAVGMGQTE